jgi:hypothetical protein
MSSSVATLVSVGVESLARSRHSLARMRHRMDWRTDVMLEMVAQRGLEIAQFWMLFALVGGMGNRPLGRHCHLGRVKDLVDCAWFLGNELSLTRNLVAMERLDGLDDAYQSVTRCRLD